MGKYTVDGLDFATASKIARACAGSIRRSDNGIGFTVSSDRPFDDDVDLCDGLHEDYEELRQYLRTLYIPSYKLKDAAQKRVLAVEPLLQISLDAASDSNLKRECRELILGGPEIVGGMPGGNQSRVFKEHPRALTSFEDRLSSPSYVLMRDGFALNNGVSRRKLLDLGGVVSFVLGRNPGMTGRDALFQAFAELQVAGAYLDFENIQTGDLVWNQGTRSGSLICTIEQADLPEIVSICSWPDRNETLAERLNQEESEDEDDYDDDSYNADADDYAHEVQAEIREEVYGASEDYARSDEEGWFYGDDTDS